MAETFLATFVPTFLTTTSANWSLPAGFRDHIADLAGFDAREAARG